MVILIVYQKYKTWKHYNFKSRIDKIKAIDKSKATKAILELKAKPMKSIEKTINVALNEQRFRYDDNVPPRTMAGQDDFTTRANKR